MIQRLDVWEDAQDDIRQLASPALMLAALAAINTLLENPWLGSELRQRRRVGDLRGLRRLAFDEREWKDKPRFRVVYRNEPDDAVVEIVSVIAVGRRERLGAYRDVATGLRAERRRGLRAE